MRGTNEDACLFEESEFRELVLRRRLADGSHFVSRTSDPERALANLLERDHLFTPQLRGDVEAAGLAWADVDGSRSVGETVVDVANRFRLDKKAGRSGQLGGAASRGGAI